MSQFVSADVLPHKIVVSGGKECDEYKQHYCAEDASNEFLYKSDSYNDGYQTEEVEVYIIHDVSGECYNEF